MAGRKAIVTGAASGMGRATAQLLARQGAHVAVTDLDQTACDKIVGEIEAAGFTTARAYAMDMSDNGAIAATAKTIIDDLGGLDIVVNNAGMALPSPIDGDDYPAHWEKAWPSCWKARKCLSVKAWRFARLGQRAHCQYCLY